MIPRRGGTLAWRAIAAIAFGGAMSAHAALAQSTSAPPAESDWRFQIAPYFWAAGLKGDSAPLSALPTVSVGESFDEIIEDLEFALLVFGEARRGDWAFTLDFMYQSLDSEADTPGPLFSEAELDSVMIVATPAASYSVYRDGASSIEIGAGGRIWHVENEVGFRAGLLPARSADETKSWVDPIVLLRARLGLGSSFYLSGYADVGGFGVASDSTWQLTGAVGYRFSDHVDGVLGYRHLSVDYEDGGFVWDVEMSGPILGVSFHF